MPNYIDIDYDDHSAYDNDEQLLAHLHWLDDYDGSEPNLGHGQSATYVANDRGWYAVHTH